MDVLYREDVDVLSEEAILQWAKQMTQNEEDENAEPDHILLQQSNPFRQWLEEAEEDDDDDEEDEE